MIKNCVQYLIMIHTLTSTHQYPPVVSIHTSHNLHRSFHIRRAYAAARKAFRGDSISRARGGEGGDAASSSLDPFAVEGSSPSIEASTPSKNWWDRRGDRGEWSGGDISVEGKCVGELMESAALPVFGPGL